LHLADVFDVGCERARSRFESLLDLLEACLDLLGLQLSQIEEVLLHTALLFLNSLAESSGELPTLHQDETLGVLSGDSIDGKFPLRQVAELGSDILVV
jgi:hypothetical protein